MIIAIVMVIGLVPGFSVAASAAETASGEGAFEKDADGYYEIANANDWKSFALDGCVVSSVECGTVSGSQYYGYDASGSRIATGVSTTDLANGTVLAALNAGNTGLVWGQDEGSAHPILLSNNDTAITPITYVAEVNGTSYESIADAISAAAATEGSTLKLLANVDGGIAIDGGKFTLDLNGYSITNNNRLEGLTINGGNITVIDSSVGKTGTINDDYAINITGGSCNINGGTITGSKYGVHITGGYCYITGGTVIGKECGVFNISASCKISGGTITSESYGV